MPASSARCGLRARPDSKPSSSAPLRLTTKVPNGNGRAVRARHRAVDEESQHRADAADHDDAGPDRDGHRRTRTRRTSAVAM